MSDPHALADPPEFILDEGKGYRWTQTGAWWAEQIREFVPPPKDEPHLNTVMLHPSQVGGYECEIDARTGPRPRAKVAEAWLEDEPTMVRRFFDEFGEDASVSWGFMPFRSWFVKEMQQCYLEQLEGFRRLTNRSLYGGMSTIPMKLHGNAEG